MEDRAQVVKHLEMIQGVINRLGHDSFLVKGWSMTILVVGIIIISRSEMQFGLFVLAFLIPVIRFLDFRWLFSLARAVVSESLRRGQTARSHRFCNKPLEARKQTKMQLAFFHVLHNTVHILWD